MSVRNFLLMIFALTPLAALQTVMGAMLIFAFFGSEISWFENLGIIILCLVVILVTQLAIFKIRYKDLEDHVLLFVIDMLFSALRLPLILISDILAIVAFFHPTLEVDPRNAPDVSRDGVLGLIFIHFLMTEPPSLYSSALHEAQRRDDEPSDDPREYKWQAFRWHLKLWFVTLLHSGLVWIPLCWYVVASEAYKYITIIGVVAFFVLAPVIYILLAWWAAEIRCIRTSNQYYDNTSTTYRYYDYDEDNDSIYERSSYTVGPGWRGFISFQVVLYLITGLLWIIPQTIAVLIALFTPPESVIVPCRHRDINFGSLSLGNKILHNLFGFVIDN